MKIFNFFFCLLISINIYAGEALLENAAGITLYSADESDLPADNITNIDPPTSTKWQIKVQEVLMNALSLTGIRYTYGGSTPSTGFDCSGFVRYVFSQAANLALPPTARAIAQIGKTVKKDDLQPGDLVFFNTLQKAFSHVGIYMGNNKFIHAPRTGAAVRVESMKDGYWANRFESGQRLDKEIEKSTVN